MAAQYKRRTYYIKNSAQSKFILRFVMLSLFGGATALASFNFLAHKKIESVLYSMRLPSISPGGLLWNEMFYSNVFVVVFILIAFAITARGLFHKVHGPLKKITYDITRMTNGELNVTFSLRQHDEFQDVVNDLNKMAAGLNQRLSKIQELTGIIINQAEASQNTDSDEESSRAKLAGTIAELRKATGAFTL